MLKNLAEIEDFRSLSEKAKKLFYEGKYLEAGPLFDRIIELNPNDEEAKRFLERCRNVIPKWKEKYEVARNLFFAHNYKEALPLLEKSLVDVT